MNLSGFNTAAINSFTPDVTVRSAVYGSAYAIGGVSGRVRARSIVSHSATASGNVIARKATRHTSGFMVQAIRSGNDTVARRAPVSGQALAQAIIESNKVLLRVNGFAAAAAVVIARAIRRNPIAAYGTAQAVLTSHKLARNAVACAALAQATPVGRKLARSLLQASAVAQAVITPRAARRSVVDVQAISIGYVGANSTVLYPYDEPALEENTFYVPFENNTFYVEDGMTTIATIHTQPRDIKDTDIWFNEYFPPGDLLIEASVFVEPAGLIVGYAKQGMCVKVWTRGGVSGTKYKVTVLGSSSDGRGRSPLAAC